MKNFLCFLLLAAPAFGAAPALTLEANPSTIGTNENTVITLSVQGEALTATPKPQPSTAYRLELAGQGSANQASIINGQVTVKQYFTYDFIFTPLRVGTHTVPGIEVQTKSGTFYTPSVRITVQAAAAARAPVRQGRGFNPFASFPDDPGNPFFYWVFSEVPVLQNTGVIADLYILSENSAFLDNLNRDRGLTSLHNPSMSGGVLHEIPQAPVLRTNIGAFSSVYPALLFRRFLAYPLSDAGVRLNPPAYRLEGFFNVFIQGNPVPLPVSPGPRGLGYVGKELSARLEMNTNAVPVGGDLTLTLTIEGDGNSDYFTDPFSTAKIEGLYISQPRTELQAGIDETAKKIFLTKTFRYTASPKREGVFTIPPIELPYSTRDGRALRASTPALEFTAAPAPSSPGTGTLSPLPVPGGSYAFSSGLAPLVLAWLLGSALMVWAWRRGRHSYRLGSDETFARRVNSKGRLHSSLAEARNAEAGGRHRDGARLLLQSLLAYGADKLGLPPGISPAELAEALPPPLGAEFSALARELTAAAFGSEPSAKEMAHCLGKAEEILSRLDRA